MTLLRPPVDRPQRADARRNRERVVTAARRCMARKGLDAGMEEIARGAGVGVGTVYRHFPTKDDLVEALALERFERLRDLALAAMEADDPLAAFERFIRDAARIQTDDRALSEVLVSRPETMMRAAESVGMLDLTDAVLKRAQKAGMVRKDADARDIPMLMCALAGTYRTPHADVERYLGIMLDGLRAPGAKHQKLPPSTRA
ncbi:MAG TPA: helix-turn-helix domain-containing protein [Thermoleophilaceae bacterium]